MRCYSQVGTLQEWQQATLLPTFDPALVSFVYRAVLEDWMDLTPKSAGQTFVRLANKLHK